MWIIFVSYTIILTDNHFRWSYLHCVEKVQICVKIVFGQKLFKFLGFVCLRFQLQLHSCYHQQQLSSVVRLSELMVDTVYIIQTLKYQVKWWVMSDDVMNEKKFKRVTLGKVKWNGSSGKVLGFLFWLCESASKMLISLGFEVNASSESHGGASTLLKALCLACRPFGPWAVPGKLLGMGSFILQTLWWGIQSFEDHDLDFSCGLLNYRK